MSSFFQGILLSFSLLDIAEIHYHNYSNNDTIMEYTDADSNHKEYSSRSL